MPQLVGGLDHIALAVVGSTPGRTIGAGDRREPILAIVLVTGRVIVCILDCLHPAIGGIRHGRQVVEGVLDDRQVAIAIVGVVVGVAVGVLVGQRLGEAVVGVLDVGAVGVECRRSSSRGSRR